MFFDKYAKLVSTVDDSDELGVVNVYDDELSTDTPVMWMQFVVLDVEDSEKFQYEIYVRVVNFNDDLFFKMPEDRQQVCANSLLKRFIKWYKANYDGQLVSANFSNYDLQEKFKLACEKGIFPIESLDAINETTQEDYNNHEEFNMENRRREYMEENGSESNYFSNITFTDFVNKYYRIKDDLSNDNLLEDAMIYYDNQLNLEFELLFNGSNPSKTTNALNINMTSIGLTVDENFVQLFDTNKPLVDKFVSIFEEKLNYVFYNNEELYLEDFANYLRLV